LQQFVLAHIFLSECILTTSAKALTLYIYWLKLSAKGIKCALISENLCTLLSNSYSEAQEVGFDKGVSKCLAALFLMLLAKQCGKKAMR